MANRDLSVVNEAFAPLVADGALDVGAVDRIRAVENEYLLVCFCGCLKEVSERRFVGVKARADVRCV